MGISNLLQGLKFCTVQTNIREFSGQSIAVDASSWLHKSVYSIAEHYVESVEVGIADPWSVSVSTKYIIHRCQELLSYAKLTKIYLVVDGERCPLKLDTNQEREARRLENLKLAREYKKNGQRDKMWDKYKMCIKVKDSLTQQVMENVKKHFYNRRNCVEVVYSPYEADAQLAKLCKDKTAQAVITEDSDLLVYSASCRISFPVIFKLDRETGGCSVIQYRDLLRESPSNVENKTGLEPILQSFGLREAREAGKGSRAFVQACILTGCDYSSNQIKQFGIVNSFKQVQNALHKKHQDRFRHILRSLPKKARDGLQFDDYEEILAKSEAVFYYHPVRQQDGTIVHLNDPAEPGAPDLGRFDDVNFLGKLVWDTRHSCSQIPSEKKSILRDVTNQLKTVRQHITSVVQSKRIRPLVDASIQNPYKKSKKPRVCVSEQTNPFATFASKENLSITCGDSDDFRFVKPKKLIDMTTVDVDRVFSHQTFVSNVDFDYPDDSESVESFRGTQVNDECSDSKNLYQSKSKSCFFSKEKNAGGVSRDSLLKSKPLTVKMSAKPKSSIGPARVMRQRYSQTNNILNGFRLQRELAGEIESVPGYFACSKLKDEISPIQYKL